MAATARRRMRRRIALAVSTVLLSTLLQATVAESAAASSLPKVPASEKPVAGHTLAMKPRKSDGAPRTPKAAPKHLWAKAQTATVTLKAHGTQPAAAGSSPIALTVPKAAAPKSRKTNSDTARFTPLSGKATVRVLDAKTTRQAGVDGLLFTVQAQQGAIGNTAGVRVDYSSFAQAYGGAYGARLQLVRLPSCAATAPGTSKCSHVTPIAAKNDPQAHTLSASAVDLAAANNAATANTPVVLAATSATSSDHGDYDASPLSASSTWNTNLNTGDFSWSYDMPLPTVPSSFAPEVDLAYSSGGVDGRTANTNNQSSWVGDGFSLWSGSIERSYKPCSDDGVTNADGKKPGDLCWAYDNATLSFNGHSGELIPDGTNSFKLKGDDGTKVERLTGTTRDNGDNNQEYWLVTTTDGTRYYFGYNKLPGWSTGDETTDSTWNVPVYGDDADEPCHGSTFAASWCQQAWRWNLDYAVDTRGNAIAYYYNKETNTYARNLTPADETPYERGGYLDRIEYGLKSSAMYGTKPLAKVDFGSSERCLPQTGVTCEAGTIDDKSFYWYDTPWDLNCKADADCNKAVSPTFWTRKRLTTVNTSVVQTDGTYSPIDSWTLDHRWGQSDIDYQLLLTSIQHTGKSATPNITLPKVTFAYDQRSNRLKAPGDDTSAFIKERLSTIDDETGGRIGVTYSTAACDASSLPTPETNTSRCYPVYFTKQGDADPTRQWFNKYVVEAVTQTDRTQSSPDMITRYSYLDGAAWHYDDDEGLTKEKYKTWSTWRGYSHVRVQTGGRDPIGMKSQTDHYFLRGMDGDKATPSGGSKPVTVPDDNGASITDHDSAAGYEYKTENYSGPDGKVLSKAVNTPWHHETAKRTRSWGTTTANLTGTESARSWTSLDDGAGQDWRVTYSANTFENTAGRITQTSDYGDTNTSRDNRCTRTTYVDNATDWILDLPSRAETVAAACADTPDRSTKVISDTRTAYDGQTYGAFPTKGDPTRVATLKSHDGTTATYLESQFTYDSYGRQLTVNDLSANVTATETTTPLRAARTDGRTTTTVYSPTSGYPNTVTATTPPAVDTVATTAQTSVTTYEPRRQLPITVLDTNSKRTDTTYDALGRKTSMWLPNRSQANHDTPNYAYTYTTDGSGPLAVGTKTLRNDSTQRTGYTLYDGFLRTRQIQTAGPDGGRLIADTFYDERGLSEKTFAPYYNTSPPSPDLLALDDARDVESQTWSTYDGLGRVTKSQQVAGDSSGGALLSTTTTTYGGDRTTVTPPRGAVPTTTLTDARGNTTEIRQYHGATATGTADTTHYEYDPAGRLASVTDQADTNWSYTYDQRGNQLTATDPDSGTTTSHYDDRNHLTDTLNANNKKITHIYDSLGRETETHEGDATGTLLTKHVWDPAGFEGQLGSSTRYIGGASGDAYTTTYGMYDTLYRPHRTTVTIPAAEGTALAGSYQTNTQYNLDGTINSTSYPAAGGLATEVITPTYDDALRTKTITGTGGVTYLTDAAYSYTGKPLIYTYQAPGAKKTQVTNTYEWGTQRLHNSRVNRDDVLGTDKSATYSYDEVGNIKAVSDVSRDGTDNQCFTYDYLSRLTEAWAQNTTTCADSPTAAVLGGPAPYWQSYSYDTSGNRLTETKHDPAGNINNDINRTYTYGYPETGSQHPHFLSKVDTTGPTSVSQDTYTPDSAGNTTTRTLGGDKQTLVWDAEGHLSKVTKPDGKTGTKTTSYVYDADGNRLVTHTDTDTTLYLGTTEITLAKGSTTPKATRYYDLGGSNQAIRTSDNKLTFLVGDQNGTAQLAINATDLTLQQRRTTPFGDPRGATPTSWPGTRGYVGGTQDDSLGLVHLGAREYDPSTGRFLSVDPVLDPQNPQQLNPYAYSNSSPVTYSDPTGLENCNPNPSCSNDTVDFENGHKRNDKPKPNPGPKDGGGKKGAGAVPVGTAYDGQPTINGVRIPKFKELYAYAAWDKKKDTYAYRFQSFVHNACGGSGPVGKYIGFCKTAGKVGLLGGNTNDPFGVKANIHCVTGHGDCTEAIVSDLLTVAAWGIGKIASSARFLSLTGNTTSASAKVLRLVGAICSFRADTPVLMKNGHTKPIAKIKPGDRVQAADPKSGKLVGPRRVSARLVHHDDDLIDLKISDETGISSTLHTTFKHPFWDDTEKAWVPAGKLAPGHDLATPNDGDVQLAAIVAVSGEAPMYNLTVDQLHTYYVLAGGTPILVHNSDEFCGMVSKPNALARATGYSVKQIKEAIHKVKGQGGWRGIGDNRNPDMLIDPKTGEVHPQMPDGAPGDSVGNIYDYLPEEP
ncbi:polymorphic toxin-type HINT domain-containing protein [Streptomyces sp. NPDC051639]|uniref:polymorphic toxin-type HINT domain-containing protein n=1 Tax=Streptomyces sp. NPDC051639 TaxID=3155671 RepID=UPI00341D8C2A